MLTPPDASCHSLYCLTCNPSDPFHFEILKLFPKRRQQTANKYLSSIIMAILDLLTLKLIEPDLAIENLTTGVGRVFHAQLRSMLGRPGLLQL